MRIFVVGAGGAIGRPLVRHLVAQGHQVVATTRSSTKVGELAATGADAAAVDVLDAAALTAAVVDAKPDVLVHQATALTGHMTLRNFDRFFATTNRLRTVGTENVLAAARAGGVPRVIAQSYAGW